MVGDGEVVGRDVLRRSEERFRLLVESVLDYAIFMLDPRGYVDSWNVGAERLKGYREAEVLGRHHSTFYPAEARAAGLPDRLLAEALEHGRVRHEGWRLRRDGTRFWADVVITALHGPDGQHRGFAKVTRDMTDAHEADEARELAIEEQARAVVRLEELDRWRVELVSSIAHDLQTPVAAISGFAGLLERTTEDHPRREEYLAQVRSNARSLQHLIDHLRTHALLTEGRVQLHRERVVLGELVRRVVADMSPLFGARPLVTEVDDVEVDADPHALERVLRNLLGNAVRHTRADTLIRVRVLASEDGADVEVVDAGAGIPADLAPQVFERFGRGSTGGTGLGLSIAKQYVELHGGTISASDSPGGGTTVRFTVPTRAPAPEG